ncbi:MAG: phosphotransferase family protein [Planctomycetaceae bacterium]
MHEITESNVVGYLRDTGRLPPEVPATGTTLAWGVSNIVLRVHPDSGPDLVVKQSREKLRTKADWFSRLDRIWREIDVMKALAPLLPEGAVPRVLFEDRANYVFGMDAIDVEHVVWKEELLSGRADAGVAATLGEYLATIHRETAGVREFETAFNDRQVFDELRIDPYYRYIAGVHEDLRPAIQSLIDETLATNCCIVHADFSPKNVLITEVTHSSVWPGSNEESPRLFDSSSDTRTGIQPERHVSLVDFETGHYGDPAFDHGFFLAHLLLKTIKHREHLDRYLRLARVFWDRYSFHAVRRADNPQASSKLFPIARVESQAVKHLGACLLARIDGKSTIDYLSLQEQNIARDFARELLQTPPRQLETAFAGLWNRLAEFPQ